MLIAGSSGLIGRELRRVLLASAHQVGVLVRGRATGPLAWSWSPEAGRVPMEALDWAEVVVNLAGAPLSRLPWTAARRQAILQSRLATTGTLAKAIAEAPEPPRAWLNASATGYYGHRPGEALDEGSGPGSGFLTEVVQRWEAASRPAERATRLLQLRTGLVLAKEGALAPLVTATRWGAGARMGNGSQVWPWISLQDEVAAIVHLMNGSDLSGAVNLVGPTPAMSVEITRALAALLRRPHAIGLPARLLRLALGEAADELLLNDQRIAPSRLLADGFVFAHASAREALEAVLRR